MRQIYMYRNKLLQRKKLYPKLNFLRSFATKIRMLYNFQMSPTNKYILT